MVLFSIMQTFFRRVFLGIGSGIGAVGGFARFASRLHLSAAILFGVTCVMLTQAALAEVYIDSRTVCPFSLLNPGRTVTSLCLAWLFFAATQGAKNEKPAEAKKYRPLDILIGVILSVTPFTSWFFPEAYMWVQGASIALAGGWMGYRLLRGNTALKAAASSASALCLTAFLGWLFLYQPYNRAYPQGYNDGAFNACGRQLQEGKKP
jgi:hypothetical protein